MKKQTQLTSFSLKIIRNTSLYICLLFAISLNSHGQATAKIDSAMGCIGDTLIIKITVTNVINIVGFSNNIDCDPAVLSYIGVQNIHPELTKPGSSPLLIFQTGSSIKTSWYNVTDSATILNEVIYELIFIYGGGSSWLHGSGDYGYLTLWTDGYVYPSTLSLYGKVTYDDTLSPHQAISNTLLKLYDSNGALIDSTYTNQIGDYNFLNVCNGTYNIETSCAKPWGGVNSIDALMIMRHFAGLNILTGLSVEASDVDGSGFVNTIDALYVVQRFVFIINSFINGDWVFDNDSIVVNGSNVVHNFKGLCVGDVNASYVLP